MIDQRFEAANDNSNDTDSDDDWYDPDVEEEGVPWEESNGYVGSTWDNDYDFFEGLKPLEGFAFTDYWELFPLPEERRTISFLIDGKPHEATMDAHRIEQLVEAIPFVTAEFDCPANQGPCSGSGYGFAKDPDVTVEAVQKAARALRFALEADLLTLKQMEETATGMQNGDR